MVIVVADGGSDGDADGKVDGNGNGNGNGNGPCAMATSAAVLRLAKVYCSE